MTAPDLRYNSAFRSWYDRASVRTAPRRELTEVPAGSLYFPPELVPATAHPLVAALPGGAVERLLVHRLYQYLDFTVELELSAVVPVAGRLGRGTAGLAVPDSMRRDAFKIATDEAWHAQFTDDLLAQVVAATGIAPRLPERSGFLDRLARIHAEMPVEVAGADGLLFAIVSETLVSSLLAGIPKDGRLPASVRRCVADHAEDEGRHHAYFRSLLTIFWPQLTARERALLGPFVPRLVHAFLEPDACSLSLALRDLGLSAQEADAVIADVHPRPAVYASIARAARNCVRYFEEVGALADPGTRAAFEAAGLLTE